MTKGFPASGMPLIGVAGNSSAAASVPMGSIARIITTTISAEITLLNCFLIVFPPYPLQVFLPRPRSTRRDTYSDSPIITYFPPNCHNKNGPCFPFLDFCGESQNRFGNGIVSVILHLYNFRTSLVFSIIFALLSILLPSGSLRFPRCFFLTDSAGFFIM